MCWSPKHPVSSSPRLPFTWENHMQKSRSKTFLKIFKTTNQRCQFSNCETITMGTHQLTWIGGSPQLQNKPSGLSEIFTRDLYWDLILGNMLTLSGRKLKRCLPRKWEGWGTLMTFFALVFTGKCSSQTPQLAKGKAGIRRMKNYPQYENIRFKNM